MNILFATQNKGKSREVSKIFNPAEIKIYSLADIGDTIDVLEDGETFEANARKKAEEIFKKYKVPAISDDSGLVVEQLGGRPGIHSARYAGEECSFEDNNKKLLMELEFFPEPHEAKFVCCAVYYDGDNFIVETGELKGEIIKEFRGNNGFGYDPVFIPENSNLTLAEIQVDEKNKISHRSKAFQKLLSAIKKGVE